MLSGGDAIACRLVRPGIGLGLCRWVYLIDQIDEALLVDYAELAIDIASMRPHGCLRDIHCLGNVSVAVTARQETQHLVLTLRERA